MKATLFRPCCAPLFLDAHSNGTSSTRHASFAVCSISRNRPNIPKLEPFSRTRFEKAVKDPPLIEKSKKEVAGLLHLFKFRIFFMNRKTPFGCFYLGYQLKFFFSDLLTPFDVFFFFFFIYSFLFFFFFSFCYTSEI